MGSPALSPNQFSRSLDALAFVLIACCFLIAWNVVVQIEWPVEIDFYRDMGTAASMLEGNYPADPSYEGEVAWYNPLVPSLAAATAAIFHYPIHVVYAKAGPFFNLFAPLCFYLVLLFLTNRRIALAALLSFLVLGDHSRPSWLHPTYSPWLWPLNFSQSLFCLTLLMMFFTAQKWNLKRATLSGVCLGLTFLGHTAPAAILAVTAIILTAKKCRESRSVVKRSLPLFFMGGFALLVSSIFLLPLVLKYGFHIKNDVPTNFVGISASEIFQEFFTVSSFIAIFGLMSLLRGTVPIARNGRVLLLSSFVATLGFLAYGILGQVLSNEAVLFPQLLPTFHFYFYYKLFEDIFFGIGLVSFLFFLEQSLRGKASHTFLTKTFILISPSLLFAPFALSYVSSSDLADFQGKPDEFVAKYHLPEITDWIEMNTSTEDVFLATSGLDVFLIAANSRKLVSLPALYSNPYVSHSKREKDRRRMFQFLREGDLERFYSLAEKYHTKYLMWSPLEGKECCQLSAQNVSSLPLMKRFGDIRIHRIS